MEIKPALIAVFFFLKLKQQSCINMFKLLLLLFISLKNLYVDIGA